MRMDELAESLPQEAFTEVQLNLEKPKKVWVTTLEVEVSRLEGIRSVSYSYFLSFLQLAQEQYRRIRYVQS